MQKRALKRFACGFFALAVGLAFASPALAHRGSERHHHGGKRPIGEVSAFDGTTLSVLVYRSGETVSGTVADGSKVKLDHRGKPEAKGNPTKGDFDDLVVGAKVLKLKLRDGMVRKVKVRTFETTQCGNGQPDNGQIETEGDEGDEGDDDDEFETEGDEGDEGDDDDELETEGDEGDEGDDDEAETEGDEVEGDEGCGSDDDKPETEDSEDDSEEDDSDEDDSDEDSEDESEEDDSDEDDSDDDLLDAVDEVLEDETVPVE